MGLGFGVWGVLGFRVYGCGVFCFRVEGLWDFGVRGFGVERERECQEGEGGREREREP